jgi:flavin reductase (DIM6/NTAB) family NADH-FMN oxidoreductase RutF
MTIAWGGICSSQPPCVTVSIRSATYTHSAIVQRKAYTVNIPSSAQVAEADFAGMVSGRDRNKFAECGFTAKRSSLVDAPYIDEVGLVLECRVVQTHEVGIHTMFIGEILDVKAEESMLRDARAFDIRKVAPVIYDPSTRSYLAVGEALGPGWELGKAIAQRQFVSPNEKTE